jgi:purine-cytosine permease-like protein
VFPRTSRVKVTLITGMIVAVFGAFPAVAMKLLDFVSLYGLVLMPMGAVIFVDFWLLPRLRLRQNWAEATGRSFNWAAGAAWIVTLAVCLLAVKTGYTQITS